MDFETRYNAMEQAKLIMIQRLLFEIACLKGDEASHFIDKFRNACVSEINETVEVDGEQRPTSVSTVARSIVEGTAAMAKDRIAQRRAEGDP